MLFQKVLYGHCGLSWIRKELAYDNVTQSSKAFAAEELREVPLVLPVHLVIKHLQSVLSREHPSCSHQHAQNGLRKGAGQWNFAKIALHCQGMYSVIRLLRGLQSQQTPTECLKHGVPTILSYRCFKCSFCLFYPLSFQFLRLFQPFSSLSIMNSVGPLAFRLMGCVSVDYRWACGVQLFKIQLIS